MINLTGLLPTDCIFESAHTVVAQDTDWPDQVLGIVTVGSRTIATVGSKITKLTNSSAFAVQSGIRIARLLASFYLSKLCVSSQALWLITSVASCTGATIAVLLSSAVGLPVSTSHCLVGSLVGVGFAAKHSGAAASRVAPLDLGVLKKIVVAWIVTIPLAVVLALLVYVPLRSALSVESHHRKIDSCSRSATC